MRPTAFLFFMMISFAGTVLGQQVIYVDLDATGQNNGTSWEDAYVDLQDALADAAQSADGDEIWVAEGIYKPVPPNGDREVSFELLNNVSLYGGFDGTEKSRDERDPSLHVTALSGDLNGDDEPDFVNIGENSYRVVNGSMVDATAILDGFQVTGGNADGPLNSGFDRGGGIYVSDGSPTVVDCLIRSNTSAVLAGGVYCQFSDSLFSGCIVSQNDGRGLRSVFGSVTLVGCTFIANAFGGVSAGPDPCQIINTAFIDNGGAENFISGGGVTVTGNESVLYNCTFIGNSVEEQGGGLFNTGDDVVVVNCKFDGNTAGQGANIWNQGRLDMINCTLTGGNSINGGGVYHEDELLTVSNSILWANGAGSEMDQIWLDQTTPGELLINYSIVEGWTGKFGGVGNNGLDPLFVDPDGPDDIPGTEDDDLRLMPASPAIDSGDNTAVPADALDLDGDGDTDEPVPLDLDGLPRFVDDTATKDTGVPSDDDPSLPIVDRGAYEFPHLPPCDGDANADGTVDPLDLGYILSRFGCEVGTGNPACDAADVNADGVVDPLDVGYVLSRFGTCE